MNWEDELRKLSAPEPPGELLVRILASRAAGARVLLPGVAHQRFTWRELVVAAAAAVVIALAIAHWRVRPEPHRTARAEDVFGSVLQGTVLSPTSGAAQEATGVRSPRYPLIEHVTPEHVMAGTWTFESWTITDGILKSKSDTLDVTVTPGGYREAPVWLVTNRIGNAAGHDTAYIARATLRPLRYAAVGTRSAIIQEYTADSVTEAIDVTGPHAKSLRARARLPVPLRASLLPGWRFTDLGPFLQSLPLDGLWRGSAYRINLVSNASHFPAFLPLDLRVRRSKRISVSPGEFDCWEIEAAAGDERATLWVSKRQHWIIKIEQRWWSDLVREQVLVSYATPPAP